MKRKPILLDKIMESGRGRGREVIGLIGTNHGTGVTHTGLMLSFYMGVELGKRTAFLECNSHRDMRLIQNAYEWVKKDEESFSFRQVTCYHKVNPRRIAEIFGEDYECLIFDFGTEFSENKEEFLRCSTKIVIGGRSEWDIQKLSHFIESCEAIRGNKSWLFLVPQASEKTVLKISKEIGRSIWAVPFTEEPTKPNHNSNRFFGKIFRT